MNFIKKIFLDETDERTHQQFVRFGKGEYNRRAILNLRKTSNIKIKGSFEFANDFVVFASELSDAVFNGNILSKNEIPGFKGKKKAGTWVYEVKDFTSNQIKEITERVYCFLLDADGEGIKLRIKKKLPKPGKNEAKIDDKFCQLELDGKYYGKIKEDFLWDLPDCKKMGVEHKFIINEIVQPEGEKDFAKIREMSKRKGKIIRTADCDGKEVRREKEFEA